MRGYQCAFSGLGFRVWTHVSLDRLITSKDHASVQINIADVDANGRALWARPRRLPCVDRCGRRERAMML